ncbi:psp1 domain-containing protein [Moniliophthora roreri MCA 2997]|uniref:Psp1 domain-containing protein n=2 Tax=Moniliophthora roreri TaxID=221103 RepID=V2Y9G8_MONRO|nr:psp1 domain-containing protein [Moniliophthora roreri MCA 2997]
MNDDRPNRFTTDSGPPQLSHRERAASQPPRTSDQPFLSSPIIPSRSPWSNQGNAGRLLSPTTGPGGGGGGARAIPVPMPSRSASFSTQQRNSTSSSYFGSAMRDRSFSSTFEEDDENAADDFPSDDADYDFVGRGFGDSNGMSMSPSTNRGRQFASEWSRSRSQSLATTTARAAPMPIGSPSYGHQAGTGSAFASWNEGLLSGTNSLNVPGALGSGRWGEIRPPIRNPTDISNQSPFVRDVSQILLEENSQFKQLWNQHNGGRDREEILSSAAGVSRLGGIQRGISAYGPGGNGGNVYGAIGGGLGGYGYGGGGMGSGTSSRRHSVSVVQPRRGVQVGFDTGGHDEVFGDEDDPRSKRRVGGSSGGGAGGLMLSDEDLLGSSGDMGIGMLSLNSLNQSLDAHLQSQQRESSSPGQSQQHTPQGQQRSSGTASASSSLPIYAPLSRSPPGANDLVSSYRNMNLSVNIQGGDGSSSGRSRGDTPSERGVSPSKAPGQPVQQQQHFFPSQQQHQFTQPQQVNEGSYAARARAPSQSGGIGAPISPTATRGPGFGVVQGIQHQQPQHQQQQGFFSHQQQQLHQAAHHQQPHIRQPSNDLGHHAPPPQPSVNENSLGKGLPLSSVPSSWPLYIVEFKAGRTDLFYLTDQDRPIKVGDLVIVEADRGRDLGRVVNDSITVGEVERWLESKEHGTQFWSTGAQQQQGGGGWGDQPMSPTSAGGSAGPKKEINPKMIYGKAGAQEATQLAAKLQDETKALQLCQTKVRAKKLPMEVVDAEYQW